MKNGRYENDGVARWYLNGVLHREGGPAIEWADGSKVWWIDGKRHREDGPAIEYSDNRKKWYLNNQEISEEEFSHWLEKKILNNKLQSTLDERHKNKKNKI